MNSKTKIVQIDVTFVTTRWGATSTLHTHSVCLVTEGIILERKCIPLQGVNTLVAEILGIKLL